MITELISPWVKNDTTHLPGQPHWIHTVNTHDWIAFVVLVLPVRTTGSKVELHLTPKSSWKKRALFYSPFSLLHLVWAQHVKVKKVQLVVYFWLLFASFFTFPRQSRMTHLVAKQEKYKLAMLKLILFLIWTWAGDHWAYEFLSPCLLSHLCVVQK